MNERANVREPWLDKVVDVAIITAAILGLALMESCVDWIWS